MSQQIRFNLHPNFNPHKNTNPNASFNRHVSAQSFSEQLGKARMQFHKGNTPQPSEPQIRYDANGIPYAQDVIYRVSQTTMEPQKATEEMERMFAVSSYRRYLEGLKEQGLEPPMLVVHDEDSYQIYVDMMTEMGFEPNVTLHKFDSSPTVPTVTENVTDVSAPTAVSGENMQMLDYLDTYKRIYDKYAAIYGDGFEFTPCIIAHGNTASEAAGQKINQMKKDFQRELYANIPSEFLSFSDPDFAAKATASGLTLREYAILQGADETKLNEMVVGGYAPDTIEKMFYLEKYGLEGLSTREQINKIMAQFGKGTFGDFSKGLGILSSVGAITGDEHRRAISQAHGYARDEEFGKALEMYDCGSFEEFYKQYWANIILHMQNAASAKYDWEDVFRNNMYGSFSYDGHDSLTTKLFG